MNILPFARFYVKGESMEPAIKHSERILVFMWAYIFSSPFAGDIVVVADPKNKARKLLKRVANVIDSRVWVLGDNFKFSTDSRNFGPLEKKLIIGRPIFKY